STSLRLPLQSLTRFAIRTFLCDSFFVAANACHHYTLKTQRQLSISRDNRLCAFLMIIGYNICTKIAILAFV
ncbi:MAG TPA: hypothetical protein PK230_08010, partial [Chitinophagales bacterium]|nr:hypothetical protein [Chitinophagales bacterium]